MRGFSLLACLAALAGSTASAVAQQPAEPSRPKTPAPGGECTTTEPGRVECRRILEGGLLRARMDSMMMNRAALGLQLSATGTARDTLGVFVSAVTPKGPAETAGIIEGDRIVSINGVDLRVSPADVEDSYASGLPSHRLQREVAKLTPGARVNVRVYSGGRVRDVQVTAGRASDLMRSRGIFGFGGFGDGPGNMFIFHDGMRMPEMPEMPEMPMGVMPPMGAMPPMARMAPMPMMERMGPMELMPGMKRMELRSLPYMREMEGGRFRMLAPYRIRTPRGTMKVRSPNAVRKIDPERLRIEKLQKAKADSLKKSKR